MTSLKILCLNTSNELNENARNIDHKSHCISKQWIPQTSNLWAINIDLTSIEKSRFEVESIRHRNFSCNGWKKFIFLLQYTFPQLKQCACSSVWFGHYQVLLCCSYNVIQHLTLFSGVQPMESAEVQDILQTEW